MPAHRSEDFLTALLKAYWLPSRGHQAVLLARLTAHEATLVSPPFIAVTETAPFGFLKMPNEIRDMVYKELLTLKGTFCWRVANILGANKQIYGEAQGLLYLLNTIKIKIDILNRLWLNSSRTLFDISVFQKHHYSENDRTNGFAPPKQWLELPTYLRRCENIKFILTVKGTFLELIYTSKAERNAYAFQFAGIHQANEA
ncbi:MAG: hypothetical protein ALECFALPRED_001301 [Alectoria fallacina]|uniref:Uncharacterized protein n=1 Tax=Alectoria fallacina TaxID=1903189 RepID=A0A8H3F5M6_9LECA|nr:MAG: hypothetical protein ALECFALPRED_001301 [Alectoria fallacina]